MDPLQSFNQIKAALSPGADKAKKSYYKNAIKSLNRNERSALNNGLKTKGKLDDASIQAMQKVHQKVQEQIKNENNPNYKPLTGRSKGILKSLGRKWDNLVNNRISSKKLIKTIKHTTKEASSANPTDYLEKSNKKKVVTLDKVLEEVEKKEILELQNQVQLTNPRKDKLDLQSIPPDFFPKYKAEIEGVNFYFTPAFLDTGSHCVLTLIQIQNKVYPRVFYLSNSQGCWRVMPVMNKYHGRYGKGLAESDTQIPFKLNFALHTLPLNDKDDFESFKDIVKNSYDGNFSDSYEEGIQVETFITEPEIDNFQKGDRVIPWTPFPQTIKLPEDNALPNFKSSPVIRTVELRHYGKIEAKIFNSKDQTKSYLFYEAKDGKVFLAGVEETQNNPISIFGVRKKGLALHGCDSPLLEYIQQIPKDFEPIDPSQNKYVDDSQYMNNWNYVREIPLIQMYYREQGRVLPEKI